MFRDIYTKMWLECAFFDIFIKPLTIFCVKELLLNKQHFIGKTYIYYKSLFNNENRI